MNQASKLEQDHSEQTAEQVWLDWCASHKARVHFLDDGDVSVEVPLPDSGSVYVRNRPFGLAVCDAEELYNRKMAERNHRPNAEASANDR